MSKRSVVHKNTQKYETSPGNLADLSFYPDEIRQLAANIVLRAVSDWIDCIIHESRGIKKKTPAPVRRAGRPRAYPQPDYDEIREFFQSDYGAFVCDFIGLDAELILAKLEKWLTAYRTKGLVPDRITTSRGGIEA